MVYHLFSLVQSFSDARLFTTPWTAHQWTPASGLPVHRQLPELAQTHVHLVGDAIQPSHLCHPLLLLPSIFLSIRIFSSESALGIKWPKYWSFSFSISPSNGYSELISFRMDCKKCLVHLFCNKVIDMIEFNLPSCLLLSMFSLVFFL